MVVNEEDVVNIMGGMEHAGGIKLNDHKRKLKNRFEISKKLGQGTYGKVQLGINKETAQRVAIKTIKKSKIETEADLIRIRREIQIMSSVQHPNIIHIYEVFENKEKMVLVMEIAAGGELYDYLSERKSLEELEARRIFRQISTAVFYCHKHNICHRDLKLENILLDVDGGAKIADFGLSNVFDRTNLLNTFCGSPLYASPEIVRGCPYQGPEVDCWSLGVLLYTLVYGAMPFDGTNFKRLVKQITNGDYYEPSTPSSASSLIRGMLTVKAESRATITDICNHWWVNEGYEQSCLEEAEYLSSLTPVRLDLLLSLSKQENRPPIGGEKAEDPENDTKEAPSVDIEEIAADTPIPDGMEECDVSVSEEPPDERSPNIRRKKDHKRKLENPSRDSGDPETVIPKKHERPNEDCQAPPPPLSEPMEIVEAPIYERPKETLKTPRVVRRKPKSSEDLQQNENDNPNTDRQQKPPQKPKSPRHDKEHKSHHHDQNGEMKKKSVKKEKRHKHVENGEPFERPEPRASPRPPRTPPPPDYDIYDPPAKQTTESVTGQDREDESLPPPLPEKKRKSPGDSEIRSTNLAREKSEKDQCNGEENGSQAKTNELSSPPQSKLVSMEASSDKDSKADKAKRSDKHERSPEVMDISGTQHVASSPKEKSEGVSQLVNIPCDPPCSSEALMSHIEDNLTVIPKETVNKENSHKEIDNGSSLMEPRECDTSGAKEFVPQAESVQSEAVHIKSTHPPFVAGSKDESASTKLCASVPAESRNTESQPSQSCVAGPQPTLNSTCPSVATPESRLENSNLSPQSNDGETDQRNSNAKNQKIKAEGKKVPPPLVKPFPSQPTNTKPMDFALKNISSPEPTSVKPPWVKDENKTRIVPESKSNPHLISKQTDTRPPNDDIQKASSSNLDLELTPENKEFTAPKSISNLPKENATLSVKEPDVRKDMKSSTEGIQPPLIITETQPPLVVPFPGKPSQIQQKTATPPRLVKTDSPKSLINNIPKPFKVGQDKSMESVKDKEKEKPILDAIVQKTQEPSLANQTFAGKSIHQESEAPLSLKGQTEDNDNKSESSQKNNDKHLGVPLPVQIENVEETSPSLQVARVERKSPVKQPNPSRIIINNSVNAKSTDSVGSAITLSSDGDPRSAPGSPMILPKPNGPNINLALISPSNSGSNLKLGDQQRDSKVCKAAAYWNNYIGDVTAKNRPPSNPKMLEKPKKITSAGIGEKGLKELTSAFEQGKPITQDDKFTIMRRNSKKLNMESCNPGLRVNDAKSHFEKKFQQPPETPRITRRASATLEKPKWAVKDEGTNKSTSPCTPPKSPSPSKSEGVLTMSRVQSEISSPEKPMTMPNIKSKSRVSNSDKKYNTCEKEDKLSEKQNRKEQPNLIEPTSATELNTSEENTEEKQSEIKSNGQNIIQIQDQIKPPTSPKPKVKKEELKIKEEIAKSKENKLGNQIKIRQQEETTSMMAPLKVNDKESMEKAVVKNLKDIPNEINNDMVQKPQTGIELKSESQVGNDIKIPSDTQQHILKRNSQGPLQNHEASTKTYGLEIGQNSCDETVTSMKNGSPKIETETAVKMVEQPNNLVENGGGKEKVEVPHIKNTSKDVSNEIQNKVTNIAIPEVHIKNIDVKSPEPENTSTEQNKVKNIAIPKVHIKHIDVKSPEPENISTVLSPEPKKELSGIRGVLKKVPLVSRRKSFAEKDSIETETPQPPTEKKVVIIKDTKADNPDAVTREVEPKKEPVTEKQIEKKDIKKKERIIPIHFVNENRTQMGPKPYKVEADSRPQTPVNSLPVPEKVETPKPVQEHHIPIVVEGGKSQRGKNIGESEEAEHSEKMDNFNASSISRRRLGSRKKRMSSAFSDSVSDDDALSTPFGGLQKYSSCGKHGPGDQVGFTLRKTRPPFSVNRTESFSSGEEDFDDEEGFQEMTAENLFSTLLSRVKSLTRRIHDEHDDHLNWQQKQRHGPPRLNPGGTHARLERTAQRNSIKRGDRVRDETQPTYAHHSPTNYSREEPDNASLNRSSLNDSPSLRSSYGSPSDSPRKIYNRSNSSNNNTLDSDSRYSTGSRFSTGSSTKRYDESDRNTGSDNNSNISVTSSQRLRPGYLPPPSNINNDNAASNSANLRTSSNSNDIDAHSIAQSVISRAQDVINQAERSIPISIQRQNSGDSPTHSKPGTPLPKDGVYMKHMRPFSSTSTNDNSQTNSRLESPEPVSEGTGNGGDKTRRVSRFLRPDFYDIPKEDSIYAKMRELEDEEKSLPRYLRVGQSRTSKSGRNTPLDYNSYNSEDRSKSDSLTKQDEGAGPASEGSRNYIRSVKNRKKSGEENDNDPDILVAGINKLRRQGKQFSNEVSEISDGLKTPDDTESVTSDIFGVPDFVKDGEDSFGERLQRSSYLSRVEENSAGTSSARPAKKSLSKELFEDRPSRYTSTRPVARRSVSRELFDMKYTSGKTSPYSTIIEPDSPSTLSPTSRRVSRASRDGSASRDPLLDQDIGNSSGYASSMRPGAESSRSLSKTRGRADQLSRPPPSSSTPSRQSLSSSGRSNTQSELMRNSPISHLPTSSSRYSGGSGDEDRASYGGSLKDRKRQDWRRISVPERGADFNSLPRKYNRFSSIHDQNAPNLENAEFSDFPSGRPGGRTSPFSSTSLHINLSTAPSRRNSLVSNPDSYTSPGYGVSSLRRSSTMDRNTGNERARAGSISKNLTSLYSKDTTEVPSISRTSRDLGDTPSQSTYSREGSVTPNYSRYSSVLDDKHDWGFRTLRRRDSKAGLSKIYPSDDIRF